MDKIIKKILNEIEKNGFEAYLVGGFVRDYLLGQNSYDIDICTNALPKDLHKIFPMSGNSNNYGGFNLQIRKYNIDITTYRKEIKYEKRKPTEIVYINSLEEDIKRRDFTINALCMNSKERIIDPLNAIEDIENHIIKIIGDPKEKLIEDPLRILRAVRFASVLDFKIEETLYQNLKECANLVTTLSGVRIKSELSKILMDKNYKNGLELIKDLELDKYLEIEYDTVIKSSDLLLMWAQIETEKIPFTKAEKNYIINMRNLIKCGKIDNETLFKYGLYSNLAVSEYFGIDKKTVNKLYKKLPIYTEQDLRITSEEIIKLLEIKPSKVIKEIKMDIIENILNNKLSNNKK